jgi:hypothetical protein
VTLCEATSSSSLITSSSLDWMGEVEVEPECAGGARVVEAFADCLCASLSLLLVLLLKLSSLSVIF